MSDASTRRAGAAERLDAWAARLSRYLALIGLLGLACQAFAILGDVLLRWAAGAPVRGLEDAIHLLVAITLMAFFPVVMAQRENVSIGALGRLLGPRGKAVLNVLESVGMFAMTALIAWQLTRYALELIETGERSMVLGLPMAPAWIAVAMLAWFTTAVQALVVLSTATAEPQKGA